MTKSTKRVFNCLAIVFDFDQTLAVDSTDSLLSSCGLDPETFRREKIQPLLDDGWELLLANFYEIIEESRRGKHCRINREFLEKVGKSLQLMNGVPEMFQRIRRRIGEVNSDVEVEFYILSSGVEEIIRATPIAGEFTGIWASQFHFDENGEVKFLKKILTFSEKVQYMLQISKGLGVEKSGKKSSPADAYGDIPEEEVHVPLNQVIYVGDGASDMPVFHLMNEQQGFALAVYKDRTTAREWGGRKDMSKNRRVDNLAAANFGEDSELLQSILLAAESICKRIALSRLSVDE